VTKKTARVGTKCNHHVSPEDVMMEFSDTWFRVLSFEGLEVYSFTGASEGLFDGVGEVCCDGDGGSDGDKAGIRLGANMGFGDGIEESRFKVCEGFQD